MCSAPILLRISPAWARILLCRAVRCSSAVRRDSSQDLQGNLHSPEGMDPWQLGEYISTEEAGSPPLYGRRAGSGQDRRSSGSSSRRAGSGWTPHRSSRAEPEPLDSPPIGGFSAGKAPSIPVSMRAALSALVFIALWRAGARAKVDSHQHHHPLQTPAVPGTRARSTPTAPGSDHPWP